MLFLHYLHIILWSYTYFYILGLDKPLMELYSTVKNTASITVFNHITSHTVGDIVLHQYNMVEYPLELSHILHNILQFLCELCS